MIIRALREDEAYKAAMADALAFQILRDIEQKKKDGRLGNFAVGAFEDDGETLMGKIEVCPFQTNFYGEYVKAMCVGGVATRPEYRRAGCIRRCFEYLFDAADRFSWEISYLYPFSYAYYRKFGYERMTDSYDMTVKMRSLAHFERLTDFVLLEREEQRQELKTAYLRFAADINGMLYPDERLLPGHGTCDPYQTGRNTYIGYENGEPACYLTFECNSPEVEVHEFVFTTPASLRAMLGFLRTYDAQADTVKLHRVALDSPLFFVLNELIDVRAELALNTMGRAVNVEKLLRRVPFTADCGEFSVSVVDPQVKRNNKIFDFACANGKANISTRETGEYDVRLSIQAMTQLLHGNGGFELKNAAYRDGVEIRNQDGAERLFKAFPKRSSMIIEHF